MTDLISYSPCAGLLPKTIGTVTVTEITGDRLTTIAPFRGQDEPLSDALAKAHGMAAPAPGRTTGKAGQRAIWFGNRMILLQGPAPDQTLSTYAALTDQSDGWAVVRLQGVGAADVLTRLIPIDLRDKSFKRGHTARTELRHMMASVTRLGAQSYQIMVFRSFAQTLVHDLKTAMQSIRARQGDDQPGLQP